MIPSYRCANSTWSFRGSAELSPPLRKELVVLPFAHSFQYASSINVFSSISPLKQLSHLPTSFFMSKIKSLTCVHFISLWVGLLPSPAPPQIIFEHCLFFHSLLLILHSAHRFSLFKCPSNLSLSLQPHCCSSSLGHCHFSHRKLQQPSDTTPPTCHPTPPHVLFTHLSSLNSKAMLCLSC